MCSPLDAPTGSRVSTACPKQGWCGSAASYHPSHLWSGAEPALPALTWNAGDAQDMGIADGKLVHHGAWLVGIDDDHFAGGQGAGEDPHAAGGGVWLGELFRLFQSTGEQASPAAARVLGAS